MIHAYGYWLKCLDEDRDTLELRIHRHDVREKGLFLNHYSDADHASELRRKSKGGAIAIVETRSGKSRALLDAGCKTQPSVAKKQWGKRGYRAPRARD